MKSRELGGPSSRHVPARPAGAGTALRPQPSAGLLASVQLVAPAGENTRIIVAGALLELESAAKVQAAAET